MKIPFYRNLLFLHHGSVHPSVPVGYVANMKEIYKNMEMLLKHIQYTKDNWNIREI